MEKEKKIRRVRSLLYTSGMGTILFSVWSGIRSIAVFFDTMGAGLIVGDGSIDEQLLHILVGVIIGVVVVGSMLFDIYIGRKAMMTSLGKASGNVYLVLACVSLVILLLSDGYSFTHYQWKQLYEWDKIVLFVIDMTNQVILAEVVIFSILLKRWRKRECR